MRGQRTAVRGHTTSISLDQEAAVHLKQGHTRSRRRFDGRTERRGDHGWLNQRQIKPEGGVRQPGCHASRLLTELARRALRHKSHRRLRRWQAAVRHATSATGIPTAARLGLRHRQIHRLHLRERSAENGEEEPGEAFHEDVTCNGESRRRNCYSRGQGRSPGREKGPHRKVRASESGC